MLILLLLSQGRRRLRLEQSKRRPGSFMMPLLKNLCEYASVVIFLFVQYPFLFSASAFFQAPGSQDALTEEVFDVNFYCPCSTCELHVEPKHVLALNVYILS